MSYERGDRVVFEDGDGKHPGTVTEVVRPAAEPDAMFDGVVFVAWDDGSNETGIPEDLLVREGDA